ncbi:ABC transporter transmembrane domain-containing protein [Candidatus Clostridium stratigraminis]|uniref:ABC transporter transmembrane domain-containing protein n=1 Tax=Candidatus Clostridium stratigraminis TaxID=3381661 RepID=A0ABW8T3M7_9CLOT
MKKVLLNKNDISLFKRVFKYLIKYKIKYIIVLLCTILGITFGIIQPLIWANILAKLFSKEYNMLIINIGYLSIFFFMQSIINFFQSYLFSYLNENFVYDLKHDIYDRILNLPIKAFDEISVGEITSRIHSDTMAVAGIMTNQFINTITDILRIIHEGKHPVLIDEVGVGIGIGAGITINVGIIDIIIMYRNCFWSRLLYRKRYRIFEG